MDFEVYCDESGLEALTNKEAHLYTAIGGIWIKASDRNRLKNDLSATKSKHKINGEFKWNKVSPAYELFYKEVIDYFFSSDFIRFRVIYQLLHHWIFDFNSYNIFVDLKKNRNKGRLNELFKILNNANLFSVIHQVQGLPSEQSLGIQLADLLTGLVAAKFNKEITGKTKTNSFKKSDCSHA